GLIAFFDTQDVVQTIGVERRDMWGIGTQTVFGDDALEVGMVLAYLGHQTFRSMTFTIIFVRPIVLHKRFRPHGNHCTPVRMHNRCAQ
ncbi:MAG TPA: hypothetical protein VLQ80_28315, partial [Candidatus Saccharimonadia bacterium]|nr:hypothetical protein [Candidatus Saccharimonadia bacterium]